MRFETRGRYRQSKLAQNAVAKVAYRHLVEGVDLRSAQEEEEMV